MKLQFKVFILVSYITMVVVNVLANALPINNQTTGAVSDQYQTLFTPSGFTFSIWLVIYVVLGVVVYKLLTLPAIDESKRFDQIALLFGGSSVLNVIWLLLWHYERIGLSMLVMAALLVVLLMITTLVKNKNAIYRGAFSLYAGWISVAFIANFAIWLVAMGVPSFDTISVVLTVIVLIVGVLIACFMYAFQRDAVFIVVFIWAYFGILFRHVMDTDLPEAYPVINVTLVISLFALTLLAISAFVRGQKE